MKQFFALVVLPLFFVSLASASVNDFPGEERAYVGYGFLAGFWNSEKCREALVASHALRPKEDDVSKALACMQQNFDYAKTMEGYCLYTESGKPGHRGVAARPDVDFITFVLEDKEDKDLAQPVHVLKKAVADLKFDESFLKTEYFQACVDANCKDRGYSPESCSKQVKSAAWSTCFYGLKTQPAVIRGIALQQQCCNSARGLCTTIKALEKALAAGVTTIAGYKDGKRVAFFQDAVKECEQQWPCTAKYVGRTDLQLPGTIVPTQTPNPRATTSPAGTLQPSLSFVCEKLRKCDDAAVLKCTQESRDAIVSKYGDMIVAIRIFMPEVVIDMVDKAEKVKEFVPFVKKVISCVEAVKSRDKATIFACIKKARPTTGNIAGLFTDENLEAGYPFIIQSIDCIDEEKQACAEKFKC